MNGVLGVMALAATGCLLLRPPPPAAPSPAERRAAYLQANPALAPAIRAAISDGTIARGMTPADLRASLGRESRWGASTDSRYQDELEFRVPRRATRAHFEGGHGWEEEVETGATVCVAFLSAEVVVEAQCTVDWYPAPRPVPR